MPRRGAGARHVGRGRGRAWIWRRSCHESCAVPENGTTHHFPLGIKSVYSHFISFFRPPLRDALRPSRRLRKDARSRRWGGAALAGAHSSFSPSSSLTQRARRPRPAHRFYGESSPPTPLPRPWPHICPLPSHAPQHPNGPSRPPAAAATVAAKRGAAHSTTSTHSQHAHTTRTHPQRTTGSKGSVGEHELIRLVKSPLHRRLPIGPAHAPRQQNVHVTIVS